MYLACAAAARPAADADAAAAEGAADAGTTRPVRADLGPVVRVNNMRLLLLRRGATVTAITNTCSHAGGQLHRGRLIDIEDLAPHHRPLPTDAETARRIGAKPGSGAAAPIPVQAAVVECPRHRYCFDLDDGTSCKPKVGRRPRSRPPTLPLLRRDAASSVGSSER